MTTAIELPSEAASVDLYSVLGLPLPSHTRQISAADVKAAYRATILKHHPDKKAQRGNDAHMTRDSSAPPVDTIKLARSVLLSPSLRAEYDRIFLTIRRGQATGSAANLDPSTILDTVDFDDMDFLPDSQAWSWPCRCGNAMGFAVTEEALEDTPIDEDGRGELIVACEGCSLYKRVVFEDTEFG